ncbi:NADH-quinone oxidoreductase subunit NuoH [Candidatus Amarolinea aalborgensis]|uniref:NADH-quinone oxidoreductase subunit NuoH n=1 Tax=Candidatus Amarolinea aalborgensis TaxID=2249329 RepID=UPI003BF9FC51
MDIILDPSRLGEWLEGVLVGWGLPQGLAVFINLAIGATVILIFALTLVLGLIWLERKVAGRIQDRLGPNRAGPYGLLQTIADAMKLLTKEDITPSAADKVTFNIAPILAVFAVIMLFGAIPLAPRFVGADMNIGALYIVALGSIAIMSVLMAGWGSNNKYALLGGFRVVAQLLSYEVPMILAILSVVIVAGTMSMNGIALVQGGMAGFGWYVFIMPLSFMLYFVSALAEGERTPFDLLEAESEIVSGYNVEYSGMKFAWFYLAFFLNTFILSSIATTLFLGGWQGPFVEQVPLLGIVYFGIKVVFVMYLNMWVRATFPRLRIDQMMNLAWKVMVPLGLVAVFTVALAIKLPGGPIVQAIVMVVLQLIGLVAGLGVVGRSLRLAAQGGSTRVPAFSDTIAPRAVRV